MMSAARHRSSTSFCGCSQRCLFVMALLCTAMLWYSLVAVGSSYRINLTKERPPTQEFSNRHAAVLPIPGDRMRASNSHFRRANRKMPNDHAKEHGPTLEKADVPADQEIIMKLTNHRPGPAIVNQRKHVKQSKSKTHLNVKPAPVPGLDAVEQHDHNIAHDVNLHQQAQIEMGVHKPNDFQQEPVLPAHGDMLPKHRAPGDLEGSRLLENNIPEDRFLPDLNELSQGPEIQVDKAKMHDKWIVVTSVLSPSPDVKFLANLTGWRVVVVGDLKTPDNWSYPNCEYLSVRTQEALGFRLITLLPYRSYARKNIGYLYAIAHGAKVIYETDDDNRPLDRLSSFQLEPTTPGLLFSGLSLFNPYRHFGQSTLWPRGYPLSSVGEEPEMSYRLGDEWLTPFIQQGVVNGDPDMDAVFRLTRKKTYTALDVRFDPVAPFAILPEGVFSPFNSQNTLFLHSALWALMLPTTTTFRMCDIWRGYWAQRLLWEVNGRLGFFPPNAYQQRNAHSYMADAEDEKDMYFETDRLLSFLTSWVCSRNFTFFQCVYKLSFDMAVHGIWEEGDGKLTKLWLEDLIRAGYPEPVRRDISAAMNKLSQNEKAAFNHVREESFSREAHNKVTRDSGKLSDLDTKWALAVKEGSFVQFTPAEQDPPTVGVEVRNRVSDVMLQTEIVASFCPKFPALIVQKKSMIHDNTFFHDILLIVVYNWPFYGNVRYNEAMYRVLFPNIVYCGDNATKFMTETANSTRDLSFIEAPVAGGLMSYECTIRAMQMSYNVKGYLVVGEDVILNSWNFRKFDKNRIWMNSDIFVFNVTSGTNWMWWNMPGGRVSFMAAMQALKLNQTVPAYVTPPVAFLALLARNTGSDVIHALNDVYYIPRTMSKNVLFYLSYFAKYKLMVEMAVPLTLYGLQPREHFQMFKGVSLWLNERLDPWIRYTPDSHFLHPVKFSNQTNDEPFCVYYLANMINFGFSLKNI